MSLSRKPAPYADHTKIAHSTGESVQNYAASYINAGWAPVWIPPMAKAPADSRWPEIEYQPSNWSEGDNIGIKLGEKSGGLVDVDLDNEHVRVLAPRFLPATLTFGRASSPASHWIYIAPGTKTWKPARTKIELRSTGLQTVFPGSTHESGEPIEWHSDVPPLQIQGKELRACVARLALGGILHKLEPDLQNARGMHDFMLAFAGGLKASGWPLDASLDLLGRAVGLHPAHREVAIRTTYEKDEDQAATGWPTVDEIVGPAHARALRRLAEDPSLGFTKATATVRAASISACPLNDDGNADRLIDRFGESIRYCEGVGWLRWSGVRWEVGNDPYGEAAVCARETTAEGEAVGGDTGKALAEWGRQSGNASKIKACLDIASHRPELRVEADDLDADPWLLNCETGTIDLRTGELRPHAREDLITKCCPVAYEPGAQAPRFQQFLSEVMDGDGELVLYMLRFLGYALTGVVKEHVFGLWYGKKGRNGKGTLFRILAQVLGDYATTMAPDLLIRQPGSQHPTGLMDLRGARLVVTNEVAEGRGWNESLVKQLTGGDRVKARLMAKDFVEFDPVHTIIVAANTRPLVREQGPAFWSRVALLPWEVSFLGREDRDLNDKLAAELPGILYLLVAGCLTWQRDGLAPPAKVCTAGEEYKESQDTLGAFVTEKLKPAGSDTLPRATVYALYKAWAENGGEPYIMSARVLYRQLEERGWSSTKVNGTRSYRGWALKTD